MHKLHNYLKFVKLANRCIA